LPRSLGIWSYSGSKFGENMALTEFFRELKVSFCQVGVSIWEPRCGVKSVN
jgi:hypothetical protein